MNTRGFTSPLSRGAPSVWSLAIKLSAAAKAHPRVQTQRGGEGSPQSKSCPACGLSPNRLSRGAPRADGWPAGSTARAWARSVGNPRQPARLPATAPTGKRLYKKPMKHYQSHRHQQATGEPKALPRFPSFKISDCKELPQEVERLTGVDAPLVASAQTHTGR